MKKFLGLLLSAVMLVSLFWISPVEAWAVTEVTNLVINGEVPVPEEGGTIGAYIRMVSECISYETVPDMPSVNPYYYVSDGNNTPYGPESTDYFDESLNYYLTIKYDGSGDFSFNNITEGKFYGYAYYSGGFPSGLEWIVNGYETSGYPEIIAALEFRHKIPFNSGSDDPALTPTPAPSSAHNHEWTEGIIYDATETTDGLEGTYCKTCGAIKESTPISAYAFSLNKVATDKINAAKPGQTITFEFGEWNSFPKNFMEKLVAKSAQGVTFVFHYKWNHVKQEITIQAGTPIDLNFDYYGPAKMAELYGMY